MPIKKATLRRLNNKAVAILYSSIQKKVDMLPGEDYSFKAIFKEIINIINSEKPNFDAEKLEAILDDYIEHFSSYTKFNVYNRKGDWLTDK